MSKRTALALAALMICSLFAIPVGTAQSQSQGDTEPEANTTDTGIDVAYDRIGADLAELASADPRGGVSTSGDEQEVGDEEEEAGEQEEYDERQQAAAEGARAGAELAQEQGVEITQRQTQAAVDAAVRAADQRQNASVEQIQAAAKGSTHGALVQSQSVNVTQIQAGVYGGTAGAISQAQEANVEQIQSAAYGGTHGAVAQHQRANVTQIQSAAIGAAAGGTHAAAQTQRINVTQIQEAAQGGAYGSLSQAQRVNVTQIQAAAFGAAGGGAESAEGADPKKIQEASMGAAKGALTQFQEVTVEQVQSAARGACKGALTQVQQVSVTQIQRAATGAAEGAISQYQSASVVQIQSAAQGAAQGTVRQVQRVEIVQVQSAASGAAAGAARSAAQNQIVNVEQIQAAAAGAGEGAVIQIQQVNVVQIQTIAENAAGGALSQYQSASVVQIQSAARGACEGAISLTQRQEVSIEQIQTITERAAADTAATAAQINIQNDVTIYNYAKGESANPDDGDDGDEDRLRSLFASVEDETVFLANPNDEAVTVTITSDGDVRTITLSPGESVTEQFDPGTYTLTAETEDGRDVELAGRAELEVSVGDALQSLNATVENQTVTVENPNDQRVTVFLSRNGDRESSFEVPADWEVTRALDPGTYTLTAETEDGRSVPVNDQDEFEFEIEPEPEPEPAEVDLGVNVTDQNVTIENPSDTNVTVTAAAEDGEGREIDVSANETVTEEFDPGNYTLTGETADGRNATLNGESELPINVSAGPTQTVDLNASVENQTLTVENPSDTDVTTTVVAVNGDEDYTCDDFETWNQAQAVYNASDGAYGLNGDENEDDIACEGLPGAPVDADNAESDDDSTNVTASGEAEDDEIQTISVEAGETVSQEFDPGNYTLVGETEDEDREVLVNGEETFEFTIEGNENVTESPLNLNATVDGQNVTVENRNDTDVTVTASAEEGENRTFDVAADGTVTEQFDPGNYTLTGEADGRDVLVNGQQAFEFTINETDENATDENVTDGAVQLNATVDGQNVTIENRNDTDVTVTAEDGEQTTIVVSGGETVTEQFDPGNYTLTGEADGREVLVNGQEAFEFSIGETDENVTDENVTDGNLTDGNLTAGNRTDGNLTTGNLTDGNVTDGNLTQGNITDGNVTDDAPTDGNATDAVVDLNVTVEGRNVTLSNRNDTDVTVTAAPEDGENRTIEVAAEGTATAELEPGNYTLTGETEDGQPVTIDGEERRSISIGTAGDDEPERQIDSCTVIDQPGQYELTADIDGNADVCLDIRSDDVVLDGNGNAVSGQGETGIRVYNSTAESWQSDRRLENVTVRDVTVEGWDNGVELGVRDEGGPAEVTLERVDASDNSGSGVSLNDVDGVTLTGVVANDSQRGITLWEAESVTVENTTVSSNTGIGLHLAQAVNEVSVTDVRVTDNGGQGGIYLSDGTAGVEISDAVVTDNDGPGIGLTDAQATIDDTLVESNGAAGLSVGNAEATVSNVTARDNEGREVDARESGTLTATDLTVGPSATVAFESQSVALEPVPEGDLPSLPEDAEPAGPGLDVTGPERQDAVGNLQVSLPVNETGGETRIQLWRYDGTEWSPVANLTEDAAGFETEITEPGIYAPVATTEETQPDSLTTAVEGQNLTVTNPNDAPVILTATAADGTETNITAEPGDTTATLQPGTYTVSAETEDGRSVLVDGEETVSIPIEAVATPTETPETETPSPTPTENETETPTDTETPTETGTDTPEADTPANESTLAIAG